MKLLNKYFNVEYYYIKYYRDCGRDKQLQNQGWLSGNVEEDEPLICFKDLINDIEAFIHYWYMAFLLHLQANWVAYLLAYIEFRILKMLVTMALRPLGKISFCFGWGEDLFWGVVHSVPNSLCGTG